jgi:hypothetical protein
MNTISLEQTLAVAVTALIVLGAFALMFLQRWLRMNAKSHAMAREAAELERKEAKSQREEMLKMQMAQQEAARQQIADVLKATMGSQRRNPDDQPAEEVGLASGGYIIFDVPDSRKGMFHDLLKGFEDYAKLRGYVINFSIDNSFPNKVAFKFTLDTSGINVSTGQVRQDLKEYIQKVQRGDSLDDLPVVLSLEEHCLLVACMKNRISLLEHNYNLEKTAKEFFARLLRQLPSHGFGVSQPQTFYLQSGASNQAPSYLALNSPQTAQGIGNRLIENCLEQGIHIANSFNERTEQVEALSHLGMALHNECKTAEGEAQEKLSEAIDCVQKAKDELKEQDPPEPIRIRRWLETAKSAILTFALTKEVTEAAKTVWDAFGLGS